MRRTLFLILSASLSLSAALTDAIKKEMVFSRTDVELDKPVVDFSILGTPGTWDVKIMRWTQDENGSDIVTDQREVIAKPVFKKKLDGEAEILPIGVRNFVKQDVEQSYKIFLHKRDQDVNAGGVKYEINYVVKASIPPKTVIKKYTAECFDDRTVLKNDGTVRLRFLNNTAKIDLLPGSRKTIEANSIELFLAQENSKIEIECSNKNPKFGG